MWINFKILLVKFYCNLLILGDSNFSNIEKINSWWEVIKRLAPASFILGILGFWFDNNVHFFLGAISFIILNMGLGMVMHWKRKTFNWEDFWKKTLTMSIVIIIAYYVLEVVLSIAGTGVIVSGFRAVLQAATLLYPGSKILKNVFILSRGEYPPEWLMKKVYNFNKNGDLKEFLTTEKVQDELYEEIENKAVEIQNDIQSIKDLEK